ncbi:biotin--[acetyl-CoA-carboxylase] ligase [bacterium]|nr:biotin--[acetyl-CoA-carboxylase] ligase [bacterium]
MENESSAIFDLKSLQQTLRLKSVIFQVEMSSTNDVGLEILKQSSTSLPCLVLAETQSAGRGRGGNRWSTSEGALTFSLLLERANIALPLLSLVAGLSIARTLETTSELLPQLKWPNDVYVGQNKIAGVLIESNANGIVVGMGININNRPTVEHSTSLQQITCRPSQLQSILTHLLGCFFDTFEFAATSPQQLIEQCQNSMLYLGREICFDIGTQEFAGTFLGLDDSGGMILETSTGRETIISAKNIRLAD